VIHQLQMTNCNDNFKYFDASSSAQIYLSKKVQSCALM